MFTDIVLDSILAGGIASASSFASSMAACQVAFASRVASFAFQVASASRVAASSMVAYQVASYLVAFACRATPCLAAFGMGLS